MDDAIFAVSPYGHVQFEKSVAQILVENNLGFLLYGGNDELKNLDPIHLDRRRARRERWELVGEGRSPGKSETPLQPG